MPQARLPLDAAAHRLGISVSSLRRRIRARTVDFETERTASGFRYFVLVDEPEPVKAEGSTTTPGDEQPATAARLAEVMEERDWLRRRVEEQERVIDRLTVQAENNQVLLARAQESLQLLLAERTETATMESTQAPIQTPTQADRRASARPITLMARVRRWFAGR